MPRSGETFAIDNDWRRKVEARMEEKGIKRAGLAKLMKCGRTVVTDLLDGDAKRSTYVPDVHKALGWDPPVTPLLSDDEMELLKIYRALDEEGKAKARRDVIKELKPR